MTRHVPRKTPVRFERKKGKPTQEVELPVLTADEREGLVRAAIKAGRAMYEAWERVKQDPYDDRAYADYVQARYKCDVAWDHVYPERRQQRDERKAELAEAYPPGLEREFLKLKWGDAGALELPVRFLEADPWAYRTGYVKEEIIRAINRLELPRKYVERLREVVLRVIDKADGRREFRAYCRLAQKVDSPEFREKLLDRVYHPPTGAHADREHSLRVKLRAKWALEACQKPR